MYLTNFIILTLSAFFFSAVGTWLALLWLRRSSLIAQPNARSNHTQPTPTGGGIAVIASAASFMLVSGAPGGLLWAVVLLAIISFLDDKYDMLPSWRLFFQVVAVVLAMDSIKGLVFQGLLPPFLDALLAGFIWLWIINLTNFMDGIDGITGAQIIALALGLCLLGMVAPRLPLGIPLDAGIIAAACAGFLIYNWHPARLFLGDVGSIPLGLLIGYLLLSTAAAGYWIPALILPAYCLADTGVTLLRRVLRREKIWEAHSEHFYQKAVRYGRPHDAVVKDIAKINAGLVVLATAGAFGGLIGLVCLVAAYALAGLLLWYLAQPPVMKAHAV